MSRSGDWSLAWIHYFDDAGRTRLFRSVGTYFTSEECGSVITEERQTAYRPDFTVVLSTRRRFDRAGRPPEEPQCGHAYDQFLGHPRPAYGALVRDREAPPR